MKKLLTVMLLTLSLSAFAIDANDIHNAGFEKLSASQQAALVAQVEQQAKEAPAVAVEETADKVEKWVNIGAQIGKGLAGAAKELGVAANQFAETPVGVLATWLIIFHFLGGAVIHVIGGLLVWAIGLSMTYTLMRRSQHLEIEYDKDTGKKIMVSRSPIPGDDAAAWWFANGVILLAGIVTMFSW